MISFFMNNVEAKYEKLAYDYEFNDLDGSSLNLSEFKNKVIIVVISPVETVKCLGICVLWENY